MALKLKLAQPHPADAEVDTLILGVFEDSGLSEAAKAVDDRSGGQLARWMAAGDISGKAGRSALLRGLAECKAQRVLMIGLGESAKFDAGRFQKAVGDAIKALAGSPARHALLCLTGLSVNGRDAGWAIRQAALAAEHASYRYTITKKSSGDNALEALTLLGDDAHAGQLEKAAAIAEGVRLCRELGNLPPNICTPAYLAEIARGIAASHDKVTVDVLEREQMQALGMGSLLGVAAGSGNPPRLIVLKYAGGPNEQRPYALVGKAITFDSGGISLKPGPGMEEMKFDMCGGASVIGTFVAVAKLGLPINLIAVVPAVENMPDALAYRPSDVLTSMSGKTIEVLNTDAEGRLILCDALTYAQKYEPQALIDVATLTGACVVALGKFPHGLMSKHDDLADELLAAGEQVHDRAWRLPLWDDYQPLLDSGFADMANIGGKWGGAITAGCFLARFTEGQRWAHLDIAGTAWDEGRKGMATGRPVPLLVEWLSSKA